MGVCLVVPSLLLVGPILLALGEPTSEWLVLSLQFFLLKSLLYQSMIPPRPLPHIEVLSSFYDIRFLNERRNPCSCKTRAGMGILPAQTKFVIFLTCSQSTTNITPLLLNLHRKG